MQRDLFIARALRKLKIIHNGWLSPFNFRLKKKLNGKSFRIPVIKNIGWANIFNNDPWMSQLFTKILSSSNGVFLDIGANIGQTLLKVRSVNPDLTYYGFEPNPVCHFYLKELISANNLRSSYIVPVGLSDKSVLAKLNFYSTNLDDATASVVDKLRPDAVIKRQEFVFLASLDELIQSIDEIVAVIKIDVEGAELEVIRGALSVIEKYRPLILVEVLPAYTSDNTARILRQNELEVICKSSRYFIFQIIKDVQNNMVALKKIDHIGIKTSINDIDFLLVPEEYSGQVEWTNF